MVPYLSRATPRCTSPPCRLAVRAAIASRRRCEQSSRGARRGGSLAGRVAARASSGCPPDGGGDHHLRVGGTCSASCPDAARSSGAQALHVDDSAVGALTSAPSCLQTSARPSSRRRDGDEVESARMHLSHRGFQHLVAIRSAASGLANRRAATAISRSCPRRRAARRSRRSGAGVSSLSGITTAAPPSAIQRALAV